MQITALLCFLWLFLDCIAMQIELRILLIENMANEHGWLNEWKSIGKKIKFNSQELRILQIY